MKAQFNMPDGNCERQVTATELRDYALSYRLDAIAPGRYSSLFILDLMMLEKINGIDPFAVIDELMVLEGMRSSLQTKPASEFTGKFLKGLWHKHFIPALPSVIAQNIINHLGKHGTKN